VIHENGRLALLGSLFYFDHFLGCAPMVVFFALLLAGGGAYGSACPSLSAARRARRNGFVLLSAAAALLAAAGAIALAAALSAALTLWSRPGLEAFRNPRWLAHSLRELATVPLTGVPVAIAAIVLLESALTGRSEWKIRLRWPPVVLLALAGAMALLELAMLGETDPLALAQRPRFAPEGLSIAYLLASHVFEHFLDFVWLSILSAGLYALLRARRAPAADARLVGSFSGNQGIRQSGDRGPATGATAAGERMR
jgi:hypothetical protein